MSTRQYLQSKESPMNAKNSSTSKTTPTRNAKPQTISTDSKSSKTPIRQSAQKNSNKTTPVADPRDKSASKRSVTPTSAKEKAAGTPVQQPRSASAKKTQELQAPSASKNSQASPNPKKTPQALQQTTLSPGNPKFVPKSAQSSSRKSETQVPDLGNEGGLSFDLRKDLTTILDSKTADVKITVTKTIGESNTSPSKQTKTASQQKGASESKRSRNKSGTKLDYEVIEVRGSDKGSEVKVEEAGYRIEDNEQEDQGEERSTVRKEYSAYEDWRILETVEKEIPEGSKISRSFWNTVNDPLTGKRLLDGKRTSESLRDRYKRYIASLDDVGKDTLREFAKTHDAEIMKKYHCLFKKVDGMKQFLGVSDQHNYNSERLQRKTPYGTKPPTKEKEEQKTSKSRRKNPGQVEREFDQHQMEEEIVDDDIEDVILTTSEIRQAPVKTKQFEVQKPTVGQASKGKAIINATSTRTIIRDDVEPVQQQRGRQEGRVPADFDADAFSKFDYIKGFVSFDDVNKKNKKRKVPKDDDYETIVNIIAPALHREMKKVRITSQYDDSSLQLNDVFAARRQSFPHPKSDEANLMVLVDLSREYRHFVRANHEQQEEDEAEKHTLKKLSEKYKISLNEIVLILRKVSHDYADLEEYLKRRDSKILWTEEEDCDLLQDNHTAIKYLKMLKGEDRVEKRLNYLVSR